MKQPNSRTNLDKAIQKEAVSHGGYIAARAVIANTVIAQMLPDGAVKGGSAIKLRLGDSGTRFTTDLDVARASAIEEFSDTLASALAHGWSSFEGRLVERRQAHPARVPGHYVMQPYDVKLSYNSKPWLTVALEVGHKKSATLTSPNGLLHPISSSFSRGSACPSHILFRSCLCTTRLRRRFTPLPSRAVGAHMTSSICS